jgi:hypothetical protein
MRLQQKSDPDQPIESHKFLMYVSRGGYAWRDDLYPTVIPGLPQSPHSFAVPPFMVEVQPYPERSYEPLVEVPDLFRKFRDLKPDRESLLRFANQYGWIGVQGTVNSGNTPQTFLALALRTWEREIRNMVHADRLLCLANVNDDHAIRQYVSREGDELNQLGWWVEFSWKGFSYTAQALTVVESVVNQKLSMHCRPVLRLHAGGRHTGHAPSQNLLGCIWLQFYLMAIGQLKLRRCRVCGGEMDVSGSRSSRRMHTRCSRNKRQAAWRAKPKSPETR